MRYEARARLEGRLWSIYFPRCEGCLSVAEREEDLEHQAQEALDDWLDVMATKGRMPSEFAGEADEALPHGELRLMVSIGSA